MKKKCTRLAIRVYKINFECWIHALMHFYHASSWLIPSRRYRAYNEDHSRARFRSRLRLLRVLLNNLSHRKKRAINYIHATVEWNAWTCQLSGNFVITMVARGRLAVARNLCILRCNVVKCSFVEFFTMFEGEKWMFRKHKFFLLINIPFRNLQGTKRNFFFTSCI